MAVVSVQARIAAGTHSLFTHLHGRDARSDHRTAVRGPVNCCRDYHRSGTKLFGDVAVDWLVIAVLAIQITLIACNPYNRLSGYAAYIYQLSQNNFYVG